MSGQSRVLSERSEAEARGNTGTCEPLAGPEAPKVLGALSDAQATRRTKPNSLPQISLCPVDRNRPLRNRTAGGVGGRRGQPRLLPDAEAPFPSIRARFLETNDPQIN